MRYLRWLLAWTLYGVGCMVCQLTEWLRWRVASDLLYPVYNRLMLWSCETQGPCGFGPWDPERVTDNAAGDA
jgi:hypothetical protein